MPKADDDPTTTTRRRRRLDPRKRFLIPKTSTPDDPLRFIPALPAHELNWLLQTLTPAERHAVRELVENASIEHVEGQVVLTAAVSPETLDILAAFESDTADREIDLEDEPDEGQEHDDADLEEDDPPEDSGDGEPDRDGEDADGDERAATYELTR